jgi:hypothetical protein
MTISTSLGVSSPREEALVDGANRAIPWSAAREILSRAQTYWLTTVDPEGRPHTVPVLGVMIDDQMHFAAGAGTRKGRHLSSNAAVTVAASAGDLDLVLEGIAVPVRQQVALETVAAAYVDKYDWEVNVCDGAFHDAEGAPTAGPPPYDVYLIEPVLGFGFGSGDDAFTPTRWRFRVIGPTRG